LAVGAAGGSVCTAMCDGAAVRGAGARRWRREVGELCGGGLDIGGEAESFETPSG